LKKNPRTVKPRCAKFWPYGKNRVRGTKDTRNMVLTINKHENISVGAYCHDVGDPGWKLSGWSKSTVEVQSVWHGIYVATETGGQMWAVAYYSVRLRKSDRGRARDLRRDAQTRERGGSAVLLLHIRVITASNLSPETDYPDWNISWFSSVPAIHYGSYHSTLYILYNWISVVNKP
jgi:hypothetical protein